MIDIISTVRYVPVVAYEISNTYILFILNINFWDFYYGVIFEITTNRKNQNHMEFA